MNNSEGLAYTRWNYSHHVESMPKYRRKELYGEVRTEVRDVPRILVNARDGVELLEGSV